MKASKSEVTYFILSIILIAFAGGITFSLVIQRLIRQVHNQKAQSVLPLLVKLT